MAFDATTGATAAGAVAAADVTEALVDFPDMVELGGAGLQEAEGVAGNASTVVTVGAGKYWRLVGAFHRIVTDATVANRDVVYTTRDVDDTTIEAITHDSVTASSTALLTTLFGAVNVGDAEDQASTVDYPTVGAILLPGEDVVVTVTNGVAGDAIDFYIFYIEYDNDPR
jgi:hypothetical protein